MGVIKRGILGGFSGKVAGVVGSSWKGIAVIKALPLSVANPNTTAQSNQRTKFKSAAIVAKTVLVGFVKPMWDRLATRMSGYNYFVKENTEHFSVLGVLDVDNFVASVATGVKTTIATVVLQDGSKNVVITWLDDSGADQKLAGDGAVPLVFNETKKIWGTNYGTVTRDAKTITVEMPEEQEAGEKVSCWLCFESGNKIIKFKAGSDLSSTVQ